MLNPASRFYPEFKAHMEATYEDSFFDSDALVMEMNSRELVDRTAIINHNAEKLSDMLYLRSVVGGCEGSVIKAVHYPKYRTRENFDRCRNPLAGQAGLDETGYGGLLAVTFTSLEAATAFYSALQCYKGTTLGTVFTLATAFSVLGFRPDQMKWIEDCGVEESLVCLPLCRSAETSTHLDVDSLQCWNGNDQQSAGVRLRRVGGHRKVAQTGLIQHFCSGRNNVGGYCL